MEKITVILTTFNRANNYLPTAIDAILNQTFRDFGLYIIDNGSTDNTESIVRKYKDERIHYIKYETSDNTKEKFKQRFEIGISDYVIWTHDDDEMEPHFLNSVYNYMISSANILMVSTNALIIDKNGNDIDEKSYYIQDFSENIIYNKFEYINTYLAGKQKPYPLCPTILYKRKIVNLAVDFLIKNYEVGRAEDTLLTLIINKLEGEIVILGEKLYKYRITDTQGSSNKAELFAYNRDVIGQFLKDTFGYDENGLVKSNILKWNDMYKCTLISNEMKTNIVQQYGDSSLEYIQYFLEHYSKEDITIHNIMNIMIRIYYLSKRFGEIKKEYVLWGTGSASDKTKYIIDKMLPTFNCVGYIDSFKSGIKD
ncbi:MAG: glycosyltransferase, partial [Bacteroidales bacterium]|nr:glycosyltransferase [Bacteroidales bacterium]